MTTLNFIFLYGNTSTATYPNANIDPRLKSYEWVLQYCKAAYSDSRGFMPFSQLSTGSMKMEEIKLYALGKQPVDKYKKMMSPGELSDQSWRAIDWTPPAFMCKFREIAISKLIQKKYDLQAYAIDPIATSEEDAFFNKMKVKILMREEAQKMGSELAQSPVLAQEQGEPQDLQQLAIQREFTYKHAMAMEAENAFNLIFQQNNIDELRKQVITNMYDYGIGGYTQDIDENGMVKLRIINPQYLGLSYCEKPDFSDLIHWFELIPTYVADLAPYYTKEQLDDICKKVVAKNGNPASYIPYNGFFNQAWNRFKVIVCRIKFLNWNETIYKEETDNRGNVRFGKSSYQNKQFLSVNREGKLEAEKEEDDFVLAKVDEKDKGQATPKYINNVRKVVYEADWIVDTDYMHNWGLKKNQNRKLSSWWDTDLDIQIYAWNFHKMQFTGITERLMPLEDRACMAWYNLQNLSNKLIPYLINLDMNAIEGAGFGKGGNKMKPSEIIDFIFSNYVVPFRSTDLLSRNPNYKPVSIEATGQLAAFGQLYDQLGHTLDMMRQISGLNELTDGSTPNAKTLVPVAESAIESTNNAIFLLSDSDKDLLRRTADAVVQKVQIAVQLGKVEGYAKAIGTNAIQFFKINPQIALHELGIFIDESPTMLQREALWQDATLKESQGLLTIGDKAFIMTCRNLREAYALLDYKIQKRKEELQQFELQKIQETTQGNAEVAAATEQMKQQTIQMQGEIEIQKIIIEKKLEYEIETMKKQTDLQGEIAQASGRIDVSKIAAEAKIISQQISSSGDLVKQHIANKKPQPAKK